MTTLTLGQRLHDPAEAADMGPGWDYYLDRLAAARAGTPQPEWETYYPALAGTTRRLARPGRREALRRLSGAPPRGDRASGALPWHEASSPLD